METITALKTSELFLYWQGVNQGNLWRSFLVLYLNDDSVSKEVCSAYEQVGESLCLVHSEWRYIYDVAGMSKSPY